MGAHILDANRSKNHYIELGWSCMEPVAWADRYVREEGPVFLTGMQALVRLLIDKQRSDAQRGQGVNQTFVTGYEGSPLGGFDLEVVAHLDTLNERGRTIHQFGINEKTAASAILGSQYADSGDVDAFWYGKAHGTQWIPDETWLANLAGTSRGGSMVLLCGEDHRSKSSVSPGTSDWALRSSFVPIFYPASVAEILELGMHAIQLSRWLGVVTSLKLVTPVCDGGSTVDMHATKMLPHLPSQYNKQFHPIVMALGALPMQQELVETKVPLIEAYIRGNDINRVHWSDTPGPVGIVASGKSFVDVEQALTLLDTRVPTLQLRVSWPLDVAGIRDFARDHQLETIFVVEEPGPFVEEPVKAALLGLEGVKAVYGERDATGAPLVPSFGEVDPEILAQRLAPHLSTGAMAQTTLSRLDEIESRQFAPVPTVSPMSCGGCPYNIFRDLKGEKPGGAIGCSSIRAIDAYDSGVRYIPTMGAGGSIYSGTAPFNGNQHIYQYLGDGSFFHSGRGAIQSCVQGEVNITFLLLYNGAVALTGGQTPGGQRSVGEVVDELLALGVAHVGIVSETAHRRSSTRVHSYALAQHEQALEQFKEFTGTTAIILDKECATEKGRRNKREGISPSRHVFIDEEICEGCGDCYRKSEGCAALYRVPTPFGDKTQIRQSSCDQDGLCIDGECPSFVSVIPAPGTQLRRHRPEQVVEDLPPAPVRDLTNRVSGEQVYTVYAVGRGGTGVVTISHVLAYAAMQDGLHVYLANNTGLAQKGGPVEAPIQFSRSRQPVFHRLVPGSADLYLGFDLFRAAEPHNLRYADSDKTSAVVSTTRIPTAEQNRHPDASFPEPDALRRIIDSCTRSSHGVFVDTYWMSEKLFGDILFANVILLGAASQAGMLPVSAEAIEEGLRFNGKQTEVNIQAFRWGRVSVSDPDRLEDMLGPLVPDAADTIEQQRVSLEQEEAIRLHDDALADLDLSPDQAQGISRRIRHLIEYQDIHYASRYVEILQRVRHAERQHDHGPALTEAVGTALHQLMTYKDEYEVARLLAEGRVEQMMVDRFDGKVRVERHLHPPALRWLGVGKIHLGPWIRPVMAALYRMRFLRGGRWDLFGRSRCRRLERELVEWYVQLTGQLLDCLDATNLEMCSEIASEAQSIRGFEQVKIEAAESVRRLTDTKLQLLTMGRPPTK